MNPVFECYFLRSVENAVRMIQAFRYTPKILGGLFPDFVC